MALRGRLLPVVIVASAGVLATNCVTSKKPTGAPDASAAAVPASGYHDIRDPANWETFDCATLNPACAGYPAAYDGRSLVVAGRDALVAIDVATARLSNPAAWTFAVSSSVLPSGSAYFGSGTFDGRAILYGDSFSGHIVRHAAGAPIADASSWSSFDVSAILSAPQVEVYGGAFDGRYEYFGSETGSSPPGWYALRHDARRSFDDPSAWTSFDFGEVAGAAVGFAPRVFDGTFVYSFAANVIVYDVRGRFDVPTSWAAIDLVGVTAPTTPPPWFRFLGFDGRYIYLGLDGATKIVRHDTTRAIDDRYGWAAFDAGALVPSWGIYLSAAFDGRYVTFAPSNIADLHGYVLQYDTAGAFDSAAAWTSFDVAALNPALHGFARAIFDGRYIWFPSYNGVFARYDARYPPQLPSTDAGARDAEGDAFHAPPKPGGPQAGSPWPMFGRNAAHRAYGVHAGPSQPNVRWSHGFYYGPGAPTIAADGTIYVCANNNGIAVRDPAFFALAPDGSTKWSAVVGASLCRGSVIGADGTVYVESPRGLHAFAPDGVLLWFFPLVGGGFAYPTMGPDGTIYVAASGSIYALNPDDTIRWTTSLGAQLQIDSTPALAADGTLYVGGFDGKLYALDANGAVRRTFTTGGAIEGAPAIGSDGTIYTSSDDGHLYAIAPNGALRWSFPDADAGKLALGAPTIGPDGTVYVIGGGAGGIVVNVLALNSDGTLRWTSRALTAATSGGLGMPMAIGSDGTVYVGDGTALYALDAMTGAKSWSYSAPNNVWSSTLALAADGTLLAGCEDGNLYAFGP